MRGVQIMISKYSYGYVPHARGVPVQRFRQLDMVNPIGTISIVFYWIDKTDCRKNEWRQIS